MVLPGTWAPPSMSDRWAVITAPMGWLVAKPPQPTGHGRERDEGRRSEDEGEEDRERHHLGRLAVGRDEPDDGESPQQRVGEEEDEGARRR